MNASYAGAIHGLGNLTKSGTTTLTLSGTSDYSGTTTITGGALCVNGELGPSSFFPASPVSLQSSAVLSGSGTVGDVTVTGGAIAFASSAAGIASTVTVASGMLSVGKSGIGNFLNTSGGLYVTGGGALAASPSTSATIVGNITYSSSASSTYAGMISGTGSVLTSTRRQADAGARKHRYVNLWRCRARRRYTEDRHHGCPGQQSPYHQRRHARFDRLDELHAHVACGKRRRDRNEFRLIDPHAQSAQRHDGRILRRDRQGRQRNPGTLEDR